MRTYDRILSLRPQNIKVTCHLAFKLHAMAGGRSASRRTATPSTPPKPAPPSPMRRTARTTRSQSVEIENARSAQSRDQLAPSITARAARQMSVDSVASSEGNVSDGRARKPTRGARRKRLWLSSRILCANKTNADCRNVYGSGD